MTPRARLRPVDLARLAGLSTQQIRNYEDAGILPPAVRTATGYRAFEEVHRQALLTFRTLLKGYGPVTAGEVMRAVHGGDVAAALALVDAAHAVLHGEREALRATREAVDTLAREPAAPPGADRLRIGEVAALLGVRTSALRVWEAAGLLTPYRDPVTGERGFAPSDVRDARIVRTLRAGHQLFDRIRPVLEELRREGSAEALRAALATRGEALTARSRAMLEGAGALHGYLEQGDRPGHGLRGAAGSAG
ncbi:MerR family DNA-binding transcriptional regulator [Streptomyces sp. NPDC091377]|uniref:MerR family DNA-binding transcriptional regulator n=1 Tax=Streptomyces sp. NPDC091377 TaxID=3365995 RepID=UPI0038046169